MRPRFNGLKLYRAGSELYRLGHRCYLCDSHMHVVMSFECVLLFRAVHMTMIDAYLSVVAHPHFTLGHTQIHQTAETVLGEK